MAMIAARQGLLLFGGTYNSLLYNIKEHSVTRINITCYHHRRCDIYYLLENDGLNCMLIDLVILNNRTQKPVYYSTFRFKKL